MWVRTAAQIVHQSLGWRGLWKYAVFSLIKLLKSIQRVLLSSHRSRVWFKLYCSSPHCAGQRRDLIPHGATTHCGFPPETHKEQPYQMKSSPLLINSIWWKTTILLKTKLRWNSLPWEVSNFWGTHVLHTLLNSRKRLNPGAVWYNPPLRAQVPPLRLHSLGSSFVLDQT